MAIYRMLNGMAFDDEAVKAMTAAYEAILVELALKDRQDHRRKDHRALPDGRMQYRTPGPPDARRYSRVDRRKSLKLPRLPIADM